MRMKPYNISAKAVFIDKFLIISRYTSQINHLSRFSHVYQIKFEKKNNVIVSRATLLVHA